MFSWKKSSAAEQPVSAPPVSTVALDARMQAAADAVSHMTSPAASMPPLPAASAAAPGPTLAAMQNVTPKVKASSGTPGSGGPAGNGNGGSGDTIFSHKTPEGHAKKVSEVLGEIVWLMSQSPLHKQFFISDLEWFVMTPVLLQQFRMFYAKDRPMGCVLWAFVDDETAARLASGTTKLRPQDWKSGDKLWAVEVIAPFGGAEEMIKDLKAKVFPNRELRFVAVSGDGKKEVRSM